MQNFPLVSVIVLNYNGLRYLGDGLEECLDSVLKTDYPNLEVIFVDNGSTDGSAIFVRKNYKFKITIVENKRNLGFSEGFNIGIKTSKGRYIALLSNDMTVDLGWIKPIIKLMERNPQIGIAGCKRMLYGAKNIIDGIGTNLCLCGRVRGVGKFEIDRGQYDTIREDLDFIGGAMIIRREALQKVGLFDPDYIVFSEDVDLCYRMRKQGYKIVYVPNAVLWHRRSATFKGIDPTHRYDEYMSNRSRIRFALIHFVLIRLLATFMIDLIGILLSNPTSKILLLKAYWWNLKNIVTSLKRRIRYGPSPSRYKFPVSYFSFSDIVKRFREIFHSIK